MNEKLLLKLCILSTIIGLTAIIVIPYIYGTNLKSINEITKSDIGLKVSVQGELKLNYQKEKLTLLELKDDTGKIDVVFFETIPIKGNKAKIIGTVNLYQGKLQIKGENLEFLE